MIEPTALTVLKEESELLLVHINISKKALAIGPSTSHSSLAGKTALLPVPEGEKNQSSTISTLMTRV